MPENMFDDLKVAVDTIRGVETGTIDPETITLPSSEEEPPSQPETKPEVPDEEDKGAPKQAEEPKAEEPKEELKDEKKVQTPEENAKFAEQRRQQEIEKRVQEELNKRLAETPEVKAARMLEQQYGMKPDQLLEMMQQQALMEQAQTSGVPYEVLQQQYQQNLQNQQLQQQLAEMQYKVWQTEVRMESQALKTELPFLTDEDIQGALDYMTDTLKTTNIPLKQAVMAVHGDKILENLQNNAKNEILAEQSGRKTPVIPQGAKTPATPILDDAEKHFAKIFGMSDEDWVKYKNN